MTVLAMVCLVQMYHLNHDELTPSFAKLIPNAADQSPTTVYSDVRANRGEGNQIKAKHYASSSAQYFPGWISQFKKLRIYIKTDKGLFPTKSPHYHRKRKDY